MYQQYTFVSLWQNLHKTCQKFSNEKLIIILFEIFYYLVFIRYTYKNLWKTIQTNKTWKGEFENISKDGTDYWFYITISPLYDENKKKLGYTAVREDITDKKIIEKQREDESLAKTAEETQITETSEEQEEEQEEETEDDEETEGEEGTEGDKEGSKGRTESDKTKSKDSEGDKKEESKD